MSVRLSVSVVCGLCVSCDDEVNLLCVLIPRKELAQGREESFKDSYLLWYAAQP